MSDLRQHHGVSIPQARACAHVQDSLLGLQPTAGDCDSWRLGGRQLALRHLPPRERQMLRVRIEKAVKLREYTNVPSVRIGFDSGVRRSANMSQEARAATGPRARPQIISNCAYSACLLRAANRSAPGELPGLRRDWVDTLREPPAPLASPRPASRPPRPLRPRSAGAAARVRPRTSPPFKGPTRRPESAYAALPRARSHMFPPAPLLPR